MSYYRDQKWELNNEKSPFVNINNPTTHTFLDGGVLRVPEDDPELVIKFYKILVEGITNGEPMCISEFRTDVFNYYIDFDIKASTAVEKEEMIAIAQEIQYALNQVINCRDDRYCFVSTCNSKQIDENTIKSGFHINFPMMRVDSFTARKLRQIIIQYLYTHENESIKKRDWESIVDEAVYVTSGLRMIGADKSVSCKKKNCRTSNKYCSLCMNKGKIYQNRRYFPFMILTEEGNEYVRKMEKYYISNQEYLEKGTILKFLIEKNSIRTHSPMNIKWKQNMPAWYKPEPITERVIKKRNPTKYLEDKSLTEEQRMKISGYSDLERIDMSDIRFQQLEQFIQTMWPIYKDLKIRMIKRTGRKNAKHYSYQIQTCDHYCHNIKREHTGNHIWFHIDPQTHSIYQRCFDNDCRDFISTNCLKLSNKLTTMLFPEQHQKAQQQRNLIKETLKPKQVKNEFESLFEIDDLN